jgi:dTDP-4-dehydrorhamnose 3,5-epimerase
MIKDVLEFENVTFKDHRGFFSRIYDKNLSTNFDSEIYQVNLSYNPQIHTLRGLHYQINMRTEHKVVKVINGSIYLAIVDLRAESDSYLGVHQRYLTAKDEISIFIPAGCATGWLTTEEKTNILYLMTESYENCQYSGIRYDDPAIGIDWPFLPKVISQKDLLWENLKLCNP